MYNLSARATNTEPAESHQELDTPERGNLQGNQQRLQIYPMGQAKNGFSCVFVVYLENKFEKIAQRNFVDQYCQNKTKK